MADKQGKKGDKKPKGNKKPKAIGAGGEYDPTEASTSSGLGQNNNVRNFYMIKIWHLFKISKSSEQKSKLN